MADWVTISALATAGGTLALAGATYGSVRSANRAARVAEQALQERRRPVLVDSRPDDPAQPVSYGDDYRMSVGGAAAAIEVTGIRRLGGELTVASARHWYLDAEAPR